MNPIFQRIGTRLAHYLSKPQPSYERFCVISIEQLYNTLQPGDLLLIEGNSRISSVIKYLTQSTWSHVSLFIGSQYENHKPLLEADLVEGVITVPLEKYEGYNMRICRPVNMRAEDLKGVLDYAVARIGHKYDMHNIFDLLRYLVPTLPIPVRFRRQMIAFGSGDPTKAICSTLVAQAYQSVNYPILPREVRECRGDVDTENDETLLKQKHFSHFTPRDFDLSPYFEIVKPTIKAEFDYKQLRWCKL